MCYKEIPHCERYEGNACSSCASGFMVHEGKSCSPAFENCVKSELKDEHITCVECAVGTFFGQIGSVNPSQCRSCESIVHGCL